MRLTWRHLKIQKACLSVVVSLSGLSVYLSSESLSGCELLSVSLHPTNIVPAVSSKNEMDGGWNSPFQSAFKIFVANNRSQSCCCWSNLYSAILRSQADSLRSHVILHGWLAFIFVFITRFWISTKVVYLQRWYGWCHMKLLPSRHKFCVHHITMHPRSVTYQSHIRKVYACLAVTCTFGKMTGIFYVLLR